MTKKYRVHDLAKFHYSEIGEYIDENHTDRPLRNDILVDLLNQLNDENEHLKKSIKRQQSSNDECAKLIEEQQKENEQLKQDKKRLIGYLHRYGKVDVEDIDDIILNKEYFDEWGDLYD